MEEEHVYVYTAIQFFILLLRQDLHKQYSNDKTLNDIISKRKNIEVKNLYVVKPRKIKL